MLRKRLQAFDPIMVLTAVLVIAAIVALYLTLFVAPAGARSGGIGVSQTTTTGKPGKAKLRKNGKAIPPSNAPKRVVKVINAANKIRRKPYKWGGGHGRWHDSGYDCSGAVSFALHGGRMLRQPLASGSLARWKKRGKGKWITVYANGGHAYAVIAGLRWDTSMTGGNGPRWSKQMRSARGFKKRHHPKF